MQRIPNRSELSAAEFSLLREITARSFVVASPIPHARQARLLELGLIQSGMGGLMATPAGRIVARM